MNHDHLEILRKKLEDEFISHLPLLLQPDVNQQRNLEKNRSRAYAAFGLSKMLDIDVITAAKSVVDDNDDNGLDAIYYQQNEKKIYIVQGKLKTSETFNNEDARNFVVGVRDLINQNYARFNQHVQRRQQELEFAFDDAEAIVLVVIHLSKKVTQHAENVIDNFLRDEVEDLDPRLLPTWVDFGSDDALDGLLGEHASALVDTTILISGDKIIQGQPKVVYGQISVRMLADLYNTHGTSLFEKNIRYFLGVAKSDVNRSINTTLKSEPENFFYLNNGVTAIAKKISEKAAREGKRKFALKSLSVINGAQTIASSHYFIKNNPNADISTAKVMITLIEVDDDFIFGNKITKARNHQNTVNSTHFAALDPNQEKLRRELAHRNISYRYRPEALMPTTDEIITIDEAAFALAMIHADPSLPILLKQASGTFTNPENDNYKKIFTSDLTGKKLANAVRLYKSAVPILLANESVATGQDKLMYRHSKYVVMWLTLNANRVWLNRDGIMSSDEASQLISQPLDQWKELVKSEAQNALRAAYKGPLAFFRNLTNARPFVVALRDRGLGPHQTL